MFRLVVGPAPRAPRHRRPSHSLPTPTPLFNKGAWDRRGRRAQLVRLNVAGRAQPYLARASTATPGWSRIGVERLWVPICRAKVLFEIPAR